MNVLLINPPWQRRAQDVRKKLQIESCLPSLGLGYLAAMLEKENINVRILDATVEGVDLFNLEKYITDLNEKPDYVGITATTTEILVALKAAEICRRLLPKSKMVVGGVHATVMPDSTLADKNVDYLLRGEAEYTFLELLKGKAVETIEGLSYKKNGEIINNPTPKRIENLDDLPFPAFHLMPIKKYHPPLGLFKRLPAINIITARGCPNLCTYCATHTIWGNKMKFRSVANIIEEVKYLIKRFGIREISISDDTFTITKNRIVEFCEGVLKNNIDITWTCNSRLEKVDEEALKLMKRSGCHHICYGVESADAQILKNINKNINLEKAKELITLTKKTGITCRASFMFGNPGETEETMRKTLKYVLEAKPDMAVFNVSTPYPGTPLYKWAKENNYLIDEDWFTYHGSKAHIKLPTISPDKVEKFQRLAFKKFYFRIGYILCRLTKIRTIYDVQMYIQAFKSVIKL